MKIKIKLFASIKDICGFDEMDLTVSDGTSVIDVIKELKKDHSSFNEIEDILLFAINEEYCNRESKLSDMDTLAIFPPVSGG